MMENLKEFLAKNKVEFYRDSEIKPYLTLRIGGRVKFIIVVRSNKNLEELLLYLHRYRHNFVILGGGSNVVFSDDYADLIVIINKTAEISKIEENMLRINAGVTNANLLSWNSEHNIGGMEFLAGIPGAIGGAAAVNAGAFGNCIEDILEKAEIFTKHGEIKTVDAGYFRYRYRDSIFKYSNEVILNVYLKFEEASNEKIKEKIKANIKYRKDNHPSYKEHTAGCFFKNPVKKGQKLSAGKLIEESGLKGSGYKNLYISPAHANFLINKGDATFFDIDTFSEQVRKKVFRESGILLEREVIYISPSGQKY
jgi:UDP-N-acetylmuramate dehydrogenase